MTYSSVAMVSTANAVKYATQLGKHWSHNLEVREDGDSRSILFPHNARGASWAGDATVYLDPKQDTLICRIEASEADQLAGLKGAVERHVDRFAFREDKLVFAWRDQKTGE